MFKIILVFRGIIYFSCFLFYFKFLKNAFRLKRKNLKNNLSGMYDLEKVEEVLEKYGFDLSVRAEELSEEILVDLWKNIS